MKITTLIACLLVANVGYGAASVVVNLGVPDPATPRTYAIEPGEFDFKLVNALPNKKYEILGENRQKTTTKLPEGVTGAKAVACEATNEQVQRILDAALKAKKDKVPDDKKAEVKLTEEDIASALDGDLGCNPSAATVKLNADKAKFDTDKTKFDTDKTKFDTDKTKFDTDKTKFDTDKTKFDTDKAAFDAATTKPPAEQARLTTEKARLDTEKSRLDTEKSRLDAEKARLDAEKARLDAEKGRIDAEKTRIDAIEADNVNPAKIRDRFSISLEGYTLQKGNTLQKTFKAVGEDTTWTVVITTQGGSAATTAAAAAKAASPIASASPKLDEQLKNTETHPDLIVGNCKYSDSMDDGGICARIFINADMISTPTITNIPPGEVTVTIKGEEYFPCEALRYNKARYARAPDTLTFPLHMKKGWLGLGSVGIGRAEVEAASIYRLDWCPGENRVLQKKGLFRADEPDEKYKERVEARESVAATGGPPTLADIPDPREGFRSPPIASVPLFLRGKSELVTVTFDWADGTSKTFPIRVVYQRFWLDAGGFFVFARHTDQSIETETIPGTAGPPATPEMQKVRAIRRVMSIEPSTGIVINMHPGNFPILAFQFGIAANQGRLPSYYAGLGIRALGIGKRGLATLGIGAAMQQENQFPLLQFGESYPSTSPLLKPTAKYGVTFPYISLSLGFSFGGVSEKTNVAEEVK